jgi:aquaporin NIP
MKKYFSELIGTFLMVFIGTGSVVINSLHNNIGQIGVGISFGIAVALSIFLFAKFSGAHINPAVSIALFFKDKLNAKELIGYVMFQLIGAILASLSLKVLFPLDKSSLGATIPSGTWQESFVLELFLTFFLMLVILFVQKKKLAVLPSALIIGLVVGLEAYFVGPISGASMNPARSIAPALISENINHLWLYIVATILGACIALYPFTSKDLP